MRARTLLLVIGIVLMAGFAMLNVDEFTRTSVLNLGFTTMQLPLGLLMLMVVVGVLLIFLAVTLYMQSTNLLETRQYAKQLAAQTTRTTRQCLALARFQMPTKGFRLRCKNFYPNDGRRLQISEMRAARRPAQGGHDHGFDRK